MSFCGFDFFLFIFVGWLVVVYGFYFLTLQRKSQGNQVKVLNSPAAVSCISVDCLLIATEPFEYCYLVWEGIGNQRNKSEDLLSAGFDGLHSEGEWIEIVNSIVDAHNEDY